MILDDFLYIESKLEITSRSSVEIVGSFVPDANDINLLKSLKQNQCLDDFVFANNKSKDIDFIQVGEEIKIKLYPLKLQQDKYYEDIEELVKRSNQEYPTNRFYVHSLKYDSTISEKPQEIIKFESVINLIKFLKDLADYKEGNKLIFILSKKLIFYSAYNVSDILNFSYTSLVEKLIPHVLLDELKEERKSIFILSLFEYLLKVSDEKKRFEYLLGSFEDIYKNYINSHSLYLEKYSYEKFKSELENERLDYIKKIQSVINDAQTKLVAIPVAFLLIVGQFDFSGAKMFFNVVLFFSAIIFSVLFDVLIRNQFSSMYFINEDINRFEKSISEKKKLSIGNEFAITISKVRMFYSKQIFYLNVIRSLIWLSPVFTLVFLIVSFFNSSFLCLFINLFWIIINVANKIIC